MDQQISSPVTKVVLAWGGVGASFTFSWGEFAAMLASIYTALLLSEWIWKRVGKSLFIKLSARFNASFKR